MVHLMNGEFALALREVETGFRVDPSNRTSAFHRGHVLAWNGQYDEASRQAEILFDEDPNEAMGQVLLFLTLALKGRREDALGTISPDVRDIAWMDFHLPWLMTEGYSMLCERDEALRWLERAVKKGLFNYPLLSELDPFLENIRSEERFKSLLIGVKEKWERVGRELEEECHE
jgi:tetratricopeptide (TPR) repeat protein